MKDTFSSTYSVGEDLDDFVKDVLICCKVKRKVFKTYIVKDEASGLYKIGRAVDVEKRVKSLSVANPNLSIVFVVNNNVETELHHKFVGKKFKSEWFKLNDADIKFIKLNYK